MPPDIQEIDTAELINQLDSHIKQQQLQQAKSLCNTYTSSGHYIPAFYLAKIALLENAPQTCLEQLKNAYHCDCDNLFYLNEMGNMFMTLNMPKEARLCYEDALEQYPDNVAMLINIAMTYKHQQLPEEALYHLSNAQKIEASAKISYELATLYQQQFDFEQAKTNFNAAHQFDPKNSLFTMGLGYVERDLGNKEAAIKWFEKTLTLNPQLPIIHYELAQMQTYNTKSGQASINTLEHYIKHHHPETKQLILLHATLGKIHNDLKHYDLAMKHCQKANDLQSAELSYDIAIVESAMERNRKLFTKKINEHAMQTGVLSLALCFIVGMPRSGSTLTEKILTSHSLVSSIGESAMMDMVLEHIKPIKIDYNSDDLCYYPECAPFLTKEQMQNLAALYMDGINDYMQHYERVIDKALHNFTNIGMIAHLFPNASIIHCKRHPMDMAVSMYMIHFFDPNMGYTTSFESIARFYKAYAATMKHWHDVFPGRIYDNYYERLVLNQETCTQELLAHLGLEWEDQCLAFHQNKTKAHTASAWQVTEKMFTHSLFRHRQYGKLLEPLQDLLKDEIIEYEKQLESQIGNLDQLHSS